MLTLHKEIQLYITDYNLFKKQNNWMHERLASENDWIQNQSKKITKLQKNCMYEYLKKWINPTEERENKETGI